MKVQNFLGDHDDSKLVVINDREEAVFRVVFKDDFREPLELIMADFIDVKSPKAKGKRISTLDITAIEDITPDPEPEPEEPEETEEPEQESESEQKPVAEEAKQPEETPVNDVPLIITNTELPEDSKPVDEQLSLF